MNEEHARLRGVLAQAFNNKILCMRGFARIKYLAMTSRVDSRYQRNIDEGHEDGLQEFLHRGHYCFFPELILGVSLEGIGSKDPHGDMRTLAASVEDGTGFQLRAFGDKGIMMSSFVQGHTSADAFDDGYVALSITGLPTQRDNRCLFRIDGNHRLNVVEKMLEGHEGDPLGFEMQVPYCLVIFETEKQCLEQSAVYFHNINFHHLPVPEDHLLRLVVDNRDLFGDEALREDPSLGKKYFLARKFESGYSKLTARILGVFPDLEKYWSGFLVRSFGLLLERPADVYESCNAGRTGEAIQNRRRIKKLLVDGVAEDALIKNFAEYLDEVFQCVIEGRGSAMLSNLNAETFAAVAYERHRSREDMAGFLSWYSSNRFGQLKGEVIDSAEDYRRHISAAELVEMYENFAQQKGHEIFVSMAFGKDETENHYMVIERVVREINKEIKPPIPLIVHRVDYMDLGYSYEINHKISETIMGCGLLIANLTYVNPNVYHEVGLAMGGAIAQNRNPGENMILILDTSVEKEKCDVGFNLWSYRQIRFTQSEILGQRIKNEILIHFGLKLPV